MAKFFIIFALASTAAAIDSIRYSRGIGGDVGFSDPALSGYRFGGGGGGGHGGGGFGDYGGGLGISNKLGSIRQVDNLGYGGLGLGGIGSLGGLAGLGGGYSGIGGFGGGVGLKQINSVGTSIGHHHHHDHGLGIGGISGVRSSVSSSVGHHHQNLGGIGHLGGIGALGLGGIQSYAGGINSINQRVGISTLSTIPGGYYGGILAFPQTVGMPVNANQLHIPGTAVDTYRGYFGGYYPGSVGYGQSYRFFH